jgi:hypothetical protein
MKYFHYVSVIIGFHFLGMCSVAVSETPTVVDSLQALQKATRTAQPGSVIELSDGVYQLQRDLELKRLKGSAEQPITIRAQHLLKAEFRGEHVVKVRNSEHLVLEGFRFRLKADVHGKSGALSVRYCNHCRITRNHFELDEKNTKDSNQVWLAVDGHGSGFNRIDHNRFSNKTRKGHYLFITGEDNYVSQHDLIERNHFENRSYGNDANEYETIRVGESRIGNSDGKSHTVIRENLLDRCQGEDELVSFKAGGCSFVDNTVRNCHGSVVFRNGSDGTFSGNFMLNTYADRPFLNYRAGGIRFYGSGHRVFNNYFQGLDGTSMKAPLALMHGAPAGSGALGVSDGLPATQCTIAHNTWVDCAKLRLGYQSEKRPLKPQQCAFIYNIVCETEDHQLMQLFEVEDVAFRGNILHASAGKETGIEDSDYTDKEFLVANPNLRRRNNLFCLSSGSPAIDFAPSSPAYIDRDQDGEPRGNKRDAGADEFHAESDTERTPLKPAEVGPLADSGV